MSYSVRLPIRKFPEYGGACAAVAQPVERVLGKDEVMGSSPISSLLCRSRPVNCIR